MPEICSNCGAALFEGQQFCRRCGAPVRHAGGEAPTQLFPQGTQPAQGAAVGTSPVRSETAQRAETGPVGVQQPTAYYPPANFQQTSPLVGQPFGSRPLAVEAHPPRRRRRGGWLMALFVVFLLGAGLALGATMLWWRARHPAVVKIVKTGPQGAPAVPAMPEVPAVPADLGDRIKEALKNAGVPLPLDESGATVTGSDTVFTQTYELDPGSAFAVHALNGSVTVTGTEGEGVVVKVRKRGGNAQQRGAARVLASKTDEGLTLLTTPGQDAAVSVSYEISLPRDLRQLEISADRGEVKVSGFEGSVTSDVKTGEAEFRDVSGAVRSKVIKGDTRVFYGGSEREGAQEFSVVKGNIEATLADGTGAELKAETIDGDIDVDDSFGLRVERAPVGRRVAGRLGEGGEGLLLKVTNGDIKLKK